MIQGFGQEITEIQAFGHDITEVRAMGQLAWQKGGIIPNDYTMCDYIYNSSTGGGGVDLGFKFRPLDYSIEAKFKQDVISNGMICAVAGSGLAGSIWMYNYSNADRFDIDVCYSSGWKFNKTLLRPLTTDLLVFGYVGNPNGCYVTKDGELYGTVQDISKWAAEESTNNLFIYNSRIPETLTDFNVEMGNSYGYARRVYMLSNSNRAGLDFLYGVRYFLGSDAKKELDEDSDNYVGYGFEKAGEIDGVNVYKNKYDAGLGFVLNRAMLESEFRQLDRLHKEQALLQAAVIPDEQADKCGGVTLVGPEDLDFDISELSYEIVSTDGITFEEGRITADKKDASFTISLKDIPEGQLMISFDDLLRDSPDGEESEPYEINAWDSRVTKTVLNQHSRQGVSGLKNHDLNMGNISGNDDITICLSREGTYTFDRFYVSSMSNENYDKHASECMENALDVKEYDDKHVEASVDTDEEGILFLSIPAHDNWDVYVDGEKVEKISDLDITFMGVRVPAGRHEIALRYNNRFVRYGSIVSLAGVLILALILKRRKKSNRGSTDTTI